MTYWCRYLPKITLQKSVQWFDFSKLMVIDQNGVKQSRHFEKKSDLKLYAKARCFDFYERKPFHFDNIANNYRVNR